MESLCSYDRGKKDFIGRTYEADLNAAHDFHDKLFGTLRKKKKKFPRFVFLEGNHEERIKRALQVQPELTGTIGMKDLKLEDYYDDIVEYNGGTPGVISIDGISYAHYFVAGINGKPSSSINPAYTALSKSHKSVVQGHSHLLDYSTKPTIDGTRINSLVGGCFMDTELKWAGEANKLWWRGLAYLSNVNNGEFDLGLLSIERLKKIYS